MIVLSQIFQFDLRDKRLLKFCIHQGIIKIALVKTRLSYIMLKKVIYLFFFFSEQISSQTIFTDKILKNSHQALTRLGSDLIFWRNISQN